jgi:hypothetical protein
VATVGEPNYDPDVPATDAQVVLWGSIGGLYEAKLCLRIRQDAARIAELERELSTAQMVYERERQWRSEAEGKAVTLERWQQEARPFLSVYGMAPTAREKLRQLMAEAGFDRRKRQ